MLSITPVYAALIALLFLALSINVIMCRIKLKVSVGDGGEKKLVKAMRAHANCAEYAPISLLLVAMSEFQGASPLLLHCLCAMLLAGRLLHAYGFGKTPQVVPMRKTGMYLTFAMLLLSSLTNLALAF